MKNRAKRRPEYDKEYRGTPKGGPQGERRQTNNDAGEGRKMRAAQPTTFQVTVLLWEEGESNPALKATHTLPVEAGSPVIWVYGRFLTFCKEMVGRLLASGCDATFKMRGDEVFWWTSVDQPAVLHVFSQAG